jgi:hypothetical protein
MQTLESRRNEDEGCGVPPFRAAFIPTHRIARSKQVATGASSFREGAALALLPVAFTLPR